MRPAGSLASADGEGGVQIPTLRDLDKPDQQVWVSPGSLSEHLTVMGRFGEPPELWCCPSQNWGACLSPSLPCRANAEIAQVRGKAQQEQAAYQASLRKEQLRVDALERTLEQKVRLGRGWGGKGTVRDSTEWRISALGDKT